VLGSMARMERSADPPRTAAPPWAALLGLLAATAAAALVLLETYADPLSSGLYGVAAALGTMAAGVLFQGSVRRANAATARMGFAARVAERLADAAILGAVAWVAVSPPSQSPALTAVRTIASRVDPLLFAVRRPGLAAAALTALGVAYLASYVRAKAVGLGFQVHELPGEQVLHFGLIGLGLLLWNSPVGATLDGFLGPQGALAGPLWLATLVSAASLVRGVGEVARQPETQ
jgi:hypothetical protein